MKNRFFLTGLLAAAVAFSGCSKLQKLLHLKSTKTIVAEATPSPTPVPEATPAVQPDANAKAEPAVSINRSASVIVFCYHRFEDPPRDPLAIKPSEFEAQMQAIKDHGITVIPLQDFLAWRHGEKDIPARSAIITIDDGYVSGYDTAWPILKKFGYPFTMFVYVQYINSGGKSITWDQLAEMRDAGVDIQSHTYSHQNLHGKGGLVNKAAAEEIKKVGYEGWLKKEIADSKAVLEKKLAIRVNALAYPYGKYNSTVREVINQSGYESAFTVYGQPVGFTSPAADLIGRYAITSKEPQIFEAALKASGSAPASDAPAVAQVAAASMATQPMEGETISDPKPVIKANLATMGAVEPGSVEMRVSGFGLVPAHYDQKTGIVSFQSATQRLRDKNYTVIITAKVGGKKVETRWGFNFDPAAAPAKAIQTSLPEGAAR